MTVPEPKLMIIDPMLIRASLNLFDPLVTPRLSQTDELPREEVDQEEEQQQPTPKKRKRNSSSIGEGEKSSKKASKRRKTEHP